MFDVLRRGISKDLFSKDPTRGSAKGTSRTSVNDGSELRRRVTASTTILQRGSPKFMSSAFGLINAFQVLTHRHHAEYDVQ